MVRYLSKSRIILAIVLVLILAFALVSACNFGGEGIPPPAILGIITPAENTQILLEGPVQIQSSFDNPDSISRVELWIKGATEQSETLLRSDRPAENGLVLQEWRPERPGPYSIRIRAYDANNQPRPELTRQIQIVDFPIIRGDGGEEFQPDTPTPIPTPTTTPLPTFTPVPPPTATPSPTPRPRYPPPPPIPGVPPGPTQAKLPLLHPPVCDAAEYLGPFTGDTSLRVIITEEDALAAKVVGGTTVFRAWRLRNTGTCTWGPGYELAFYGGRSMGSGGVAFESGFPPGEVRCNIIVQNDRIICAEGRPNQVAVVEVVLNAPVIPGIHQSYWRMRNPQGVYFGPIVGVTMEVVRECQPIPGGPTLYGAPVINKFEILGAGDVYRPFDPTNVIVEVGDPVVLDYNIINATNFDIVIEDPTGNIESRSTSSSSERVNFTPNRLGRYTVTLYADNGACTVQARVFVDAIPREGEQFKLDLILASSAPVSFSDAASVSKAQDVPPGTIRAAWEHFDSGVDNITFHADLYKRVRKTPFFDSCKKVPLFEDEVEVLCGWSQWARVPNESSRETIEGAGASGTTTIWNNEEGSLNLPGLPVEIQTQDTETAGMTQEQHAEFIFCRLPQNENEQYGVKYFVEAAKSGSAAAPPRSNEVDVICGESADTPTSFNP